MEAETCTRQMPRLSTGFLIHQASFDSRNRQVTNVGPFATSFVPAKSEPLRLATGCRNSPQTQVATACRREHEAVAIGSPVKPTDQSVVVSEPPRLSAGADHHSTDNTFELSTAVAVVEFLPGRKPAWSPLGEKTGLRSSKPSGGRVRAVLCSALNRNKKNPQPARQVRRRYRWQGIYCLETRESLSAPSSIEAAGTAFRSIPLRAGTTTTSKSPRGHGEGQ